MPLPLACWWTTRGSRKACSTSIARPATNGRRSAKVVVLGASCVDTTRILLNSTSPQHPNGIGNGSDVIGRYLCEQIRLNARGFMPSLYGKAATDDKGIGGEHIYMPRFNHRPDRKRDYLRGFGMQFWNTRHQLGRRGPLRARTARLRRGYKDEIASAIPAWVELHPFGEVLPYADNRITVDKTRTDRYGVPLLHIDYSTATTSARCPITWPTRSKRSRRPQGSSCVDYRRGELDRNGSAIHEHGTCRMGDDPKRSALNKFNQMHEVKNVFVVDGSAFTAASEKNPTITILSLSWRATDYLAEEMKTRKSVTPSLTAFGRCGLHGLGPSALGLRL